MDLETKKYLDSKFEEQKKQQDEQEHKAQAFLEQRQAITKKIVYICAVVMSILVLGLVFLLAWAQFIPHSR